MSRDLGEAADDDAGGFPNDLLDFVRSDIDPATVRPLEPRDLATIVNEFLLRSADILNNFCAKFEERILALECRMDSFERLLILMERKLESIPLATTGRENPKNEGKEEKRLEEEAKEEEMETKKDEEEERKEEEEEMGKGMVKAREHPTVAKYFRMLKMGVPEAAVKQKMRSEGTDNAILDDPERLLPLTRDEDKSTKNPPTPSSSSMDGDDDSSID